MIKKIKLLIFTLYLFCCCADRKTEYTFDLGTTEEVFEDINSYLTKYNTCNNVINQNTPSTYLIFTNNPYSINENYGLCLFANNKCVYKGNFKKVIPINLGDFVPNKRLHLFFEILTPSNSNELTYLHRFSTKNTIVWESNFEFIYTCFFPTNDNDDEIYFFPQKQDLTL